MSTTTAAPPRFTVNGVTLDAHRLRLTDQQFFVFCQDNRDLRFEMTAGGVFGATGECWANLCSARSSYGWKRFGEISCGFFYFDEMKGKDYERCFWRS